jgi:hypothetical protein
MVRKRRRGSHITSIVLLATGLLLGGVAILILPSVGTAWQPGPFTVDIGDPGIALNAVVITVRAGPRPDTYRMTVDAYTLPGEGEHSQSAYVDLPEGAFPIACSGCPLVGDHRSDANIQAISFTLRPVPPCSHHNFAQNCGSSSGYVVIRSPNKAFAFASDGVNALAALPEVDIPNVRSGTFVTDGYEIANGSSYDWSVGAQPERTLASVVTWDQPLSASAVNGGVGFVAASATALGVNHGAQQSQSFRTFVAGALIGVAAGALVGALQEGLEVVQRSRTRRDDESSGGS